MPLGIPDEEFIRGKVPMTKQEVRILTIAKARIKPDSVICDVGAGTGSISIEAAFQAKDGMIYAIERNPDGIDLIKQNAQKFGVYNLKVIEAYAPEGFDELPMLDAVIIGGSGSNLPIILDAIDKKLNKGGRIVMNCITIQTIAQCLEYMRKREDYTYEAVQVQVSKLEQVGPYDMPKANNPIYIVTCEKQKGAK
ncbi:precorrin-6Y C5,15-methyltransferase (decarboxylating) subunit CbiT [Anaerovibrio sp. RM50]|uniref:precorrin-6Y C5,15-methyltransferase (decarboxylating) subunit CbiT n=1 Tax=Anaerovibrio sp. RM50 TaxID=1200557 RepID=UPI0004891582|nr:precorrin-6Y C5,15-methyltransferase (decarboxylating) subunit CbiT [Anaerovibrio sp. RM50]